MSRKELVEILSPAALAKIDSYHLIARIVIEGFMSGIHRSVYHGSGSEFLQYRNYTPGDDLKYLDWKAFGRLDRLYAKIFQEETNFNCMIVLDASASMLYSGARSPCSKFRYGAMVAASLAYLASKQGDNVGFCAYGGSISCSVPARSGGTHLHRIINAISALKPAGRADHFMSLSYVSRMIRRRGLLVVISDFLDIDGEAEELLKKLRISRSDLIVIQVLDRDEIEFPFRGSVRFVDSETGGKILTAPQNVRQEYLAEMDSYVERIRKACLDVQADYLKVNSSGDLGSVLSEYLHRRGNVY